MHVLVKLIFELLSRKFVNKIGNENKRHSPNRYENIYKFQVRIIMVQFQAQHDLERSQKQVAKLNQNVFFGFLCGRESIANGQQEAIDHKAKV